MNVREIEMTQTQFLRNLEVPDRRVDVVLDTDAYNEIDDQFAVAYLLPIAGRPMLRPDEFRYAEIPREMIESGFGE